MAARTPERLARAAESMNAQTGDNLKWEGAEEVEVTRSQVKKRNATSTDKDSSR